MLTTADKLHLIQSFRAMRSTRPDICALAWDVVLEALELDVMDDGDRFDQVAAEVLSGEADYAFAA